MACETRYWTFELYEESAVQGWKDIADELIQIPYCYCKHNKDTYVDENGEIKYKKEHIHFILAFKNTTTMKHALEVAQRIGVVNHIEKVIYIGWIYDYLIHKNAPEKYQYNEEERICRNGFDITRYVTMSDDDEINYTNKIMQIIESENILYFYDLSNRIYSQSDNLLIKVYSKKYVYFEKYIKSRAYKNSLRSDKK